MKIITDKTSLTINFEGSESIWALRKQITIPKDKIAQINWHEHFDSKDSGSLWRVAGTGAPGILFAGYFRGNGKQQFVYIRRPKGFFSISAKDILVIETKDGFIHKRILLSVEKSSADNVLNWFKA